MGRRVDKGAQRRVHRIKGLLYAKPFILTTFLKKYVYT
jgi:hypothetical protein